MTRTFVIAAGSLMTLFAAAWVATAVYLQVAKLLRITAVPNERSLHTATVPRGGGIVVALATLVAGMAWWPEGLAPGLGRLLLVGGLVATVVGLADDVLDLPQFPRFVVQVGLASLVAVHYLPWSQAFQGPALILASLVGMPLLTLCLVWLFNLFNFIDGSDGMAASAVVFAVGFVTAVLVIRGHWAESMLLLALLLPCAAFLTFNWPPAKIFMGESGTAFMAFALCVAILETSTRGIASLQTWLIVLAYYVSDTSITTGRRILTVRRFYAPHRDHAYQRLALRLGHRGVLGIVLRFNMILLFPLAVVATVFQPLAWLAVVAAYVSAVVFVWRNGQYVPTDVGHASGVP